MNEAKQAMSETERNDENGLRNHKRTYFNGLDSIGLFLIIPATAFVVIGMEYGRLGQRRWSEGDKARQSRVASPFFFGPPKSQIRVAHVVWLSVVCGILIVVLIEPMIHLSGCPFHRTKQAF